jgi:hypothetical protein
MKATALHRNQRPRASFSLAGFQVTLIGRFWVTAEDAKNGTDEQLQSSALFVCILHAVIGDVSLLGFLSVLRINNLRVFNTC